MPHTKLENSLENGLKPGLLVLTSTYPRWENDNEPGFVHELSRRLTNEFSVYVLAPHAPRALCDEIMDDVQVHRFRYAPEHLEQLAYEGGISERLRHKPWRVLLVPLLLIAQCLATWRVIRQHQPAVTHAHWIFPQAFIAALVNAVSRRPVPIICTVHGADWYRLRGRFWLAIKRWTLNRCDVVAPVSGVLRQDIAQTGWAAGKLATPMPMGVDIPDRVPPLSHRDPNRLLFVGRLVPKKGLDVLLEALRHLQKSGLQLQLTVVGGGENERNYHQKVTEMGLDQQVQFLGPISHEQVYEQFCKSLICIMPSLPASDGDQEGLGLVLLEALACGCVVIASDIPVFREVMTAAGGLGYKFAASDSQALAKTIGAVLQKLPQLESQSKSTHGPVAAYSWGVSATRYLALCNRQLT